MAFSYPSESRSTMSSFENKFIFTSNSLRGASTAIRTGKSTPIGLPLTHLRHQENRSQRRGREDGKGTSAPEHGGGGGGVAATRNNRTHLSELDVYPQKKNEAVVVVGILVKCIAFVATTERPHLSSLTDVYRHSRGLWDHSHHGAEARKLDERENVRLLRGQLVPRGLHVGDDIKKTIVTRNKATRIGLTEGGSRAKAAPPLQMKRRPYDMPECITPRVQVPVVNIATDCMVSWCTHV